MRLARALAVAAVYYLLARVSLWFVVPPVEFAAIWLPSGFMLAVLLLTQPRSWPLTMAAVFPSIALANLIGGNTLAVSLGFACANTLEPVLAAFLVNRFVGAPLTFGRVREVVGFALVAVLGSNALTALAGAAVVALGKGAPFWSAWTIWFIGDGTGMMLFTPFVVTVALERAAPSRGRRLGKTLEFAGLLGAVAALTLLRFGVFAPNAGLVVRAEIVIPLLIWAAIRFRAAGATVAVLVAAFLGIVLTSNGLGPFTASGQVTALGIASLQLSLGVSGLMVLMLSATIAERDRSGEALKRSLRLLAETEKLGKVGGWEFNVDTRRQTWTEETYDIHELDRTVDPTVGAGIEFYTAASRPIIEHAVGRAIEAGEPFDVELEITTAKGNLRSVHVIGRADLAHRRVYGFFQDITGRKLAEERIGRSLREKEVLLQEVHHRVKNNLQVVSSLLNLQARSIADDAVRGLFEESRSRINSMALVHEKLYRSQDLAHIDFRGYLRALVAGIADTYQRRDVVVTVEMESIFLDVTVGIPCGLIVNELVSNSLKHAFPGGRRGAVTVGIGKDGAGNNVLTVADDGIGFPRELDFRASPTLGLQLVTVLAGQIRGTIELTRAPGTRFSIAFPGAPPNGGVRHG